MRKMWEAIQIYSRIKRPSGKGSWDDQIYMWSMPTRLSVKNTVQVTRASTYWCMYILDKPWATRRVPLVEQELLTLLDHLSSPPIFGGFCVAQFLFYLLCLVNYCLTFYFGYTVVCLFRLLLSLIDPFGTLDLLFLLQIKNNFISWWKSKFKNCMTTILPILFLYLNTVIVTAGTFEP
jgi:hypothetical protein